ncbi:MAG: nuclear transport factor 2 family protein [Sphingomicrobium sp.]
MVGKNGGDRNCELITALEHEWRDALCAKDMDRLRSLIHPNFVLIGSRAAGAFSLNRDEWLDAIQKREPLSIELRIEDSTVLEQVMVGTIHACWRINYLGRVIEDSVLLTDVWVFDEGRWRVIRRHSTPAPASA